MDNQKIVKNKNRKRFTPDFFNESMGKKISVISRFLEDGTYLIYEGILQKKGRNFLYLKDGNIFRVKEEEVKEIGNFKKIAINKAIVGLVFFEIESE